VGTWNGLNPLRVAGPFVPAAGAEVLAAAHAGVDAPGAVSRIRSAAVSALAAFRQAMITVAPCPASIPATSKPRPLLAPVTTAVLPCRSGMSVSVQ
jgi:hypothetical protein